MIDRSLSSIIARIHNFCLFSFFFFLNNVQQLHVQLQRSRHYLVLLHPESYLRLRSIDLAATILTCARLVTLFTSHCDIFTGCPYAWNVFLICIFFVLFDKMINISREVVSTSGDLKFSKSSSLYGQPAEVHRI